MIEDGQVYWFDEEKIKVFTSMMTVAAFISYEFTHSTGTLTLADYLIIERVKRVNVLFKVYATWGNKTHMVARKDSPIEMVEKAIEVGWLKLATPDETAKLLLQSE